MHGTSGPAASVDGAQEATDRIVEWYRRELGRLTRGQVATLEWLRTHPELVVLPLTVLRTVVDVLVLHQNTDGPRFRAAGVAIWGPEGLTVFADPWLQVGPVYLAALGAAARALELVMSASAADDALWVLQAALVVLVAQVVAGRLARRHGSSSLLARWAVGLALGAGGVVPIASAWGHPEEPMVALLLIAAAVLAAVARPVRAGLVLGLAAGVKQWALLGVVTGLGQLRRRRAAVAISVATAGLVTAAVYGPFLLSGHVGTFTLVWDAPPEVAQGWLWARAGVTDWTSRLVQGAITAAVGAIAALRRPAHPELVVLTIVGVKLLLEPLPQPYYLSAVSVAFLVWLWTARGPAPLRGMVLATAVPLVLVAITGITPWFATWLAVDVAVGAALWWTLRTTRTGALGAPIHAADGSKDADPLNRTVSA